MTDRELFGCFMSHECDADGIPKFESSQERRKTAFEYFNEHCRLNCVTDPKAITRLYVEHTKKLAARIPKRR